MWKQSDEKDRFQCKVSVMVSLLLIPPSNLFKATLAHIVQVSIESSRKNYKVFIYSYLLYILYANILS